MPDSSLAQRKVSGVFSRPRDLSSSPNLPTCAEVTNTSRNRALWGEEKSRNWFYSRILFPIAAGESQKSREVQGLENAPENVSLIERRTGSIRLLAT